MAKGVLGKTPRQRAQAREMARAALNEFDHLPAPSGLLPAAPLRMPAPIVSHTHALNGANLPAPSRAAPSGLDLSDGQLA